MFLFELYFGLSVAQSSSSGVVTATYTENCELGRSYSVLSQSCGARAFDDFVEVDCDDPGAEALDYCIEKDSSNTQQRQMSKKVSTTTHLDEMMDSMSTVSGTGWGVSLTASAEYVSKNSVSTHSVSFYKTSFGDSYDRKIKYTERLRLNDAAKEKLARDPEQFVSDYGTHFVSKIVYSNFFIGSVNIKQSSSESSASLGVMASLDVDKVFSGSASTEFNEAKESGSNYMDVTTDTSYNGPSIFTVRHPEDPDPTDEIEVLPLNAAEGLEDIFKQWTEAVGEAADNEQFAKATRMVFSRWTELEEVQAMFLDGFPDALMSNGPSTTLQDYLFKDTIRTQADRNAIQNLYRWNCIGKDLEDQIREIEGKLAGHSSALESIDEGEMAALQAMIDENDLTWFSGYTGELIGEVNDLLAATEECQKSWISEDYTIYPWGKPRWGPIYNKLKMPTQASDAFLTGFHFTAGRLNMEAIGVEGQSIGYQTVTSEVNGGNEHRTSKSLWKHYTGGDYESEKNFELSCAKEGMYVAGFHVDYSEVLCACATPNSGKSGKNQQQCTDGTVEWCSSSQECVQEQAYKKRNIDGLCQSRRRASDPLKSLEDEITTINLEDGSIDETIIVGNSDPDGNDYGRVISMTVHCVPLPKGSYGLPSGPANTHGPFTLKNQASTRADKDCPEGSAIYQVDWIGVARAENKEDGDCPDDCDIDAAWTLASEIEFYCRDFADFEV